MARRFDIVTDREAFFRLLGEAIDTTARLMVASPTYELLHHFSRQLEAMRNWTANGRKPTFDERRSVTLGVTAQRELQGTTDPEWSSYMMLVTALSSYFKFWRTDAGLRTLDSTDWRVSFPNDYDFSDE
jgi:hypothetical protein